MSSNYTWTKHANPPYTLCLLAIKYGVMVMKLELSFGFLPLKLVCIWVDEFFELIGRNFVDLVIENLHIRAVSMP